MNLNLQGRGLDMCIFNKIIMILMILIMKAIIVIIANIDDVFACVLIVNLPFVWVEYYCYLCFTDEETWGMGKRSVLLRVPVLVRDGAGGFKLWQLDTESLLLYTKGHLFISREIWYSVFPQTHLTTKPPLLTPLPFRTISWSSIFKEYTLKNMYLV